MPKQGGDLKQESSADKGKNNTNFSASRKIVALPSHKLATYLFCLPSTPSSSLTSPCRPSPSQLFFPILAFPATPQRDSFSCPTGLSDARREIQYMDTVAPRPPSSAWQGRLAQGGW